MVEFRAKKEKYFDIREKEDISNLSLVCYNINGNANIF
jgi:hypothetical protein